VPFTSTKHSKLSFGPKSAELTTINFRKRSRPRLLIATGNIASNVHIEVELMHGPLTFQAISRRSRGCSVEDPPVRSCWNRGCFTLEIRLGSQLTEYKSGHVNTIFQPVCSKVVDLVRTQVLEVKEETSADPKVNLPPLFLMRLDTKIRLCCRPYFSWAASGRMNS